MLLILIMLTFSLGFAACVLAMVSMNSVVPAIGESASEEAVRSDVQGHVLLIRQKNMPTVNDSANVHLID